MAKEQIVRINFDDIAGAKTPGYSDSDMILIDHSDIHQLCPALKLDANIFLFCSKGRGEMSINGTPTQLDQHHMLIVPSSSILSDVMMSPDFEYVVMLMSDRLLKSLLCNNLEIWNKAFYVHRMTVVEMDEGSQDMLENIGYCLEKILTAPGSMFKEDIVHALASACLLWLCRSLAANVNSSPVASPDSATVLFNRFLEVLSKEEVKRHPAKYYSDKLNITPKYLSFVCKKKSGKTALAWIESYVEQDIVYNLVSTEQSMKAIAFLCGFPSPAAFSKYIKEKYGKSPLEYKEQLRSRQK